MTTELLQTVLELGPLLLVVAIGRTGIRAVVVLVALTTRKRQRRRTALRILELTRWTWTRREGEDSP